VEAAVGSPWEAAGSHTAGVGVGRSRVAVGIGLGEGRMTAGGIAVGVGPGCSSLGWPFRCGFLGGCDWCWKLGFFQSVARALVMVVEGMRFRSRIVNWDCER